MYDLSLRASPFSQHGGTIDHQASDIACHASGRRVVWYAVSWLTLNYSDLFKNLCVQLAGFSVLMFCLTMWALFYKRTTQQLNRLMVATTLILFSLSTMV